MSDGIIMLSGVRLSFPNLVAPQKTKRDDGSDRISYNAEFIMLPNHPGWAAFMTRVGALAVEKWKEHASNVLDMVNKDRKKRSYGSGAEKVNQKTFKVYDGYEGMLFITAGREQPPQIIQADGSPVDPANTMAYQALTRKMYGGCRVNVAIKPWLQDNKYGRAIRCDLVAVQFAGDDSPFGEGAVDASGLFTPVATQEAAPVVPGFAMPAAPFQQAPTVPGLPSFLQG